MDDWLKAPQDWKALVHPVAQRFNHEYQGHSFDLPPEVEGMSLFRDWTAGTLQSKIASPFWELMPPQKNQRALDIGCGLSFLVYPWREWEMLFHGQEISTVARDALQSRGPQLNSKLFKGVKLAPAHHLEYDSASFDWAIATGLSCYYPIDYWADVLRAIKPLLKPSGFALFDVIDPEAEMAENWAILEMYLGVEVYMEPLAAWIELIQSLGGKVVNERSGDVFRLLKVKF
jgi:SAM-dependent methyltransferase